MLVLVNIEMAEGKMPRRPDELAEAFFLEDENVLTDEAAYVDSQYEYLLRNKDKGISLRDYAKLRGIDL